MSPLSCSCEGCGCCHCCRRSEAQRRWRAARAGSFFQLSLRLLGPRAAAHFYVWPSLSLACFGRTAKPVHAASSHTPAARFRIARAASRLESLGAPVVCLLLFLQVEGVPAWPPPPAQKKFPNFTPFCIQPHGRRIRPARRLPLARQRRHRGEHNLRRRSRALQQAAGGQCCQ